MTGLNLLINLPIYIILHMSNVEMLMNRCFYILLAAVFFILSGCDDSIYSGVENTGSSEAKTDEFDFSFIKDDCEAVSAYYNAKVMSGDKLDENDLYMYISSLLKCSGFDVIKGLDSVLQTGGKDIYETVASIIGYKKLNINTSRDLEKKYAKATDICIDYWLDLDKDNFTLNDTNLTLCGLAGTIGTVVSIGNVILNASGGAGELELSDIGMKIFGSSVDPTSVGQGLLSFLKENNSFLENLDNGLTMAQSAAKVISDLLGQDDFGNVLDELAGKMRDRERKDITENSITSYIAESLSIKIPEDVFPSLPEEPDIPDIPEVPDIPEITMP